jgi:hypothetical protein
VASLLQQGPAPPAPAAHHCCWSSRS